MKGKSPSKKSTPLAHEIRPEILEEFFGQRHLLEVGMPLRAQIDEDEVNSMILYGPPGCGKTTLAEIIARKTKSHFQKINAVDSGIADMKEVVENAKKDGEMFQQKTILFIDEIHRFNKKQQDFLLPHVENGTVILIGATTENPSFAVTSALLSRLEVHKMEMLTDEEIEEIIKRAITKAQLKNPYPDSAVKFLAILSQGDARFALNTLEKIEKFYPKEGNLSPKKIQDIVSNKKMMYDRDGEEHYNVISALHKSMRDSDEQAAVYYTMRMIEGGDDPLYIVRRMVRFASEDIGLADTHALVLAIATKETVQFLGMPEANTAIIELAVYLSRAPKSNACYEAVGKTSRMIRDTGALPVPLHIRNAVTKLMKNWNYGKGYQYAHNYENAKVDQKHLPEKLEGTKFFEE
ncbi:MAG: replication-associated recombination protein A [Patescibacteria group bacterium]